MHDAEYKLKAAVVEEELKASGRASIVRARLDAVERESWTIYRRAGMDYVRVAKALQASSPTRRRVSRCSELVGYRKEASCRRSYAAPSTRPRTPPAGDLC